MKRFKIFLIAFLICSIAIVPLTVTAANPKTMVATLDLNTNFMEQAFTTFVKEDRTVNSQIEVTLNTDTATADITGAVQATLTGNVDEVLCEDGNLGYVGVYEGKLANGIPVIADIIYDMKNAFVTLTVGALGSEEFMISVYGELTESLSAISNQFHDNKLSSRELDLTADMESNAVIVPRVQGEIIMQNFDYAYAGASSTYQVGLLSFSSRKN